MSQEDVTAVTELANQRYEQFTELSDRIWDRPELSLREDFALAEQVAVARSLGFDVRTELGGLRTAFAAEAGSGGPVIAVLGEYDALDGLSQQDDLAERRPQIGHEGGPGHACGHHLLGSASLLAATIVKERLAQLGLPGRVRYYGCPAEEASAGKALLVRAGVFGDVDAAICWHPNDVTGLLRLQSLACLQSEFQFVGIASHASAAPHLGRSALDAVELMNVGVNYLREHVPDQTRIHYAVLDTGGSSPNVVQARARSRYLVRAPTSDVAREVYARVIKVAEGAALMTGTQLEVDFESGVSELLPNDSIEAVLQSCLEHFGPVVPDDRDLVNAQRFVETMSQGDRAIAEGFAGLNRDEARLLYSEVRPARSDRPIIPGSTDVGDVSWVVPTGQITAACWAFGTPAHSWQLVAQGKLPFAHKGMLLAAKAMSGAVLELIRDRNTLDAAIAEFQQRTEEKPYQSLIPDNVDTPSARLTAV